MDVTHACHPRRGNLILLDNHLRRQIQLRAIYSQLKCKVTIIISYDETRRTILCIMGSTCTLCSREQNYLQSHVWNKQSETQSLVRQFSFWKKQRTSVLCKCDSQHCRSETRHIMSLTLARQFILGNLRSDQSSRVDLLSLGGSTGAAVFFRAHGQSTAPT